MAGPAATPDLPVLIRCFREIGAAALARITLPEALGGILKAIVPLFPETTSSIMLLDAEGDDLILVASQGLDEKASRLRFHIGEGLAGWVAKHRQPALVHDPSGDPRFSTTSVLTAPIVSIYSGPLFAMGQLVGVLNVHSSRRRLTQLESDLCELLGTLVSAEIQRHRLEQLAMTDSLTQAGNRRNFDAVIAVEAARALRYQHPLSLVAFDIDGLKQVNDLRGHPAGDALLRQVARLIRGCVRRPDHCFRTGGDEFAIVLPETGPEGARTLAERALQLLRDWRPEGILDGLRISASFGIAAYRSGEGVEELVARADQALYDAKRDGKGRVSVRS